MTEATSIHQFMRECHAYAPVGRQPGLATFIGQAAVGSFSGSFVVLIARILLVPKTYNGWFVFYLPFLLGLGLATGVVAGFLIWAAAKEADGQLLTSVRSLLGVLVMGLAWFALWYFLFGGEVPSEVQLWLLAGVVVSGVSIGLVTGSRLRLFHELVRGGETQAFVLEVFAGLIGLVLRSAVVFSLLGTLIAAITAVQLYFVVSQPVSAHQTTVLLWYLLLLGHFATGTVVLFARMRFWALVLLALISVSPVLASLWVVELDLIARYFVIGYLGAWAMFLLTRWRQTEIAWSNLKTELRYYLFD